jgi:hypothetical protein
MQDLEARIADRKKRAERVIEEAELEKTANSWGAAQGAETQAKPDEKKK